MKTNAAATTTIDPTAYPSMKNNALNILPPFLNISLCRDFTMNYIRMYIDAF